MWKDQPVPGPPGAGSRWTHCWGSEEPDRLAGACAPGSWRGLQWTRLHLGACGRGGCGVGLLFEIWIVDASILQPPGPSLIDVLMDVWIGGDVWVASTVSCTIASVWGGILQLGGFLVEFT